MLHTEPQDLVFVVIGLFRFGLILPLFLPFGRRLLTLYVASIKLVSDVIEVHNYKSTLDTHLNSVVTVQDCGDS